MVPPLDPVNLPGLLYTKSCLMSPLGQNKFDSLVLGPTKYGCCLVGIKYVVLSLMLCPIFGTGTASQHYNH